MSTHPEKKHCHNFAQYFSEIFSIFLKVSSMSPIIEIKISNLSDRIRVIWRILHFLTQMTHNIELFHFLDLYVCSFLGEPKHETKVNTKHFSQSSMTCAWVFFPLAIIPSCWSVQSVWWGVAALAPMGAGLIGFPLPVTRGSPCNPCFTKCQYGQLTI